ncbi:U4/U6 small nuclear ribonucleoprotein Prp31, putative [Perkinsus marinus ATCC 50983]|uniref:U4/U6 small nuclear ribonucleoprotein Prp31, putative n=1 Tax=Perkinsus marinus (strain ATCC 50983 / TXsc) TaxID=423536 RepID=C5KJW5_PERM5|nr:U4/U6 small nuclear ribonucleoprotein Prp31, putative [Perkinsus marinus ATCC 50983]EER15223.1 U4/U6 small nuclear ribonucleoprotein Prp31, putative [Perkinsus marinus ATCC 50983]|eukprot:XP_002783427.1 U4/U6 small nuclear ribonucleoprotein Prp31, putative [Perkinsus marinus ATCC 50983]
MSLADSFLADLDDVLDVRPVTEDTGDDKSKVAEALQDGEEEKVPLGEDEKLADTSVGVSQLLADEEFLSTMQRIRDASSAMENGEEDEEMKDSTTASSEMTPSTTAGTGTKKAEYELLSKCNTVAVTIDEDIYHIHRYVKKVYSKKFPELESIVSMPLDYLRVVQRLIEKEEADMSKVDLSDLLPNNVIVAVTVTATSSAGSGVRLPARENDELLANITAANDLADCKNDIMIFLQGQMAKHAPNLNSLLGAPLAARLISSAGGVDKLAIMPSQNIEHVGAQKKQLSGMGASTAASVKQGLIWQSDIVVMTPPDFKRKAVRLLLGKSAICARVDNSLHINAGSADESARLGKIGVKLREDVLASLGKAQAPPKAREKKPLPRPDELPGPRRGGKRHRAIKEKYGMSEARKQVNRMKFGEEAEEELNMNEAFGRGLGMLSAAAQGAGQGLEGIGRVGQSAAKQDKKRRQLMESMLHNQKLSATRRQRLAASSGNSGLSSSLAFTQFEGIELADPNRTAENQNKRAAAIDAAHKAAQKQGAAQDYFNELTGFKK